jgi:hypothetical protein
MPDADFCREWQDMKAPWKGNSHDAGGTSDNGDGLGEWDAGLDDAPIPPRAWLLGNVFCRRFVSSIVAGGGVGKTALRIAQLLALAAGRALTGEHVFRRCRVLIVSLEDDVDELRRRVRAAMRHHGVTSGEIQGWLFLAAPGPKGWKLATTEDGVHRASELVDRLVATIKGRSIDVVSLDPFVKSHGVEENANNAIDFVAGILARLAVDHDCAVDAPHHVSKGPADAGNADRGRGASAFKDAARLVYTLAPMSPEEAATFGIGDAERRNLIRMDSAKVNIAPPGVGARWFKLVGVRLDNGTEDYPNGDEVQTVEPWTPPDMWAGASYSVLNEILNEIDQGLPGGALYSQHTSAGERAAHVVVLKHLPDRTEEQARQIIKTWLKTGTLYYIDYRDQEARKDRKGLRVDATKRPG